MGVKIKVKEVSKVFSTAGGLVSALEDVDLEVYEGEFLCIVGPSGCGKTTLLKVLGGLEHATTGEVWVHSNGRLPGTAMVFQDHCIFPWFTVKENIEYGLKLIGVGREQRERICSRLLDMTGLRGFEGAYPRQLSGGMKQRVNVARAIAVDPDVLLMDEPFGSLDEHTRLLLQMELLRLWEGSGKTVVFVTHSVDEAISLGDRIVVMTRRPGRVKMAVPVDIDRPRHPVEIRRHPKYGAVFAQIWSALEEEVQPVTR
ncbi:MAG: ABC transporter ATP-binding protein [Bacillota bacterium]